MSALERVARRIGMELEHLPGLRTGDARLVWADKGVLVCEENELRDYLLTGDRPLRVQVEYRIAVRQADDDQDSGEPGVWYASAYSSVLGCDIWAFGPTPAAAIIALAEKIEGEGRE